MNHFRSLLALAAATMVATAAHAQPADDPALVARARAIHDRVITLDTHVDISPRDFTTERNYTQRLDTQVNLPKMEAGGLDAAFFIVYDVVDLLLDPFMAADWPVAAVAATVVWAGVLLVGESDED